MDMRKVLNVCYRYFLIAVATFIYSVGISLFLDPNDLAPGGITGIAIILNRLSNIETGTLIFILNIPIFAVVLWKFGIKFLISSLYAVVLITIFTNILEKFPGFVADRLLAAIVGAILCGIGIAFVFKQNSTTGGMDVIIKLLRIKYPHIKTGILFLLSDVIVIGLAGVFFGNIESVFYAGVAVFVSAKAMDFVLYGSDEARLFYIISDYTRDIADRLMKELDIGVTFLEGRGAYYNTEKEVILCACPKKVAPKVLNCVREMDRNAFMLACSANEIYGEGYKSYDSAQL